MQLDKKVFCIDKPIGWTSNDVVQFIKKKFKFKKVGHAGTLDPNATGVMVVGVNEGTKELGKLTLDDKTYIAQIQLGLETDSYDITGNVIKRKSVPNLSINFINQIINENFLENYNQYPPKFSAIKVNGKKLYEYARKNEEVEIKPRLVKINSIYNVDYDNQNKIINIELNVSKGFYIRSFAYDLGKSLGTCGCLKSLRRTSSGRFTLSQIVNINFNH